MGLFTKLRSKSKSKPKSNQTTDQFESSTTAAETISTVPESTTTVQDSRTTQKALSSPADDKKRDSDLEDDENVDNQIPKKKDKKDNGVNVRRNILATVTLSAMASGWSV